MSVGSFLHKDFRKKARGFSDEDRKLTTHEKNLWKFFAAPTIGIDRTAALRCCFARILKNLRFLSATRTDRPDTYVVYSRKRGLTQIQRNLSTREEFRGASESLEKKLRSLFERSSRVVRPAFVCIGRSAHKFELCLSRI